MTHTYGSRDGATGTPQTGPGASAPGRGSQPPGDTTTGRDGVSVRAELWPADSLYPDREFGPTWTYHAASKSVCRREKLGHDTDPLIEAINRPHTPHWYQQHAEEVWIVQLPASTWRVVAYSPVMCAASVWTCRTQPDAVALADWLKGASA